MGDTGSLTIGLLISILAIHLAQTYPTGTFGMGLNPVVIAFSPLVIPCFDVLRVYFHRLRAGRNRFCPIKAISITSCWPRRKHEGNDFHHIGVVSLYND